ncbi:hypothetical protein EBQ90_10020 [bacterium]|nr:hypothetical protein [bacterium]
MTKAGILKKLSIGVSQTEQKGTGNTGEDGDVMDKVFSGFKSLLIHCPMPYSVKSNRTYKDENTYWHIPDVDRVANTIQVTENQKPCDGSQKTQHQTDPGKIDPPILHIEKLHAAGIEEGIF